MDLVTSFKCLITSAKTYLDENKFKKFILFFKVFLSMFYLSFIVEVLNENVLFYIGFNKLIFNYILIAWLYLFVFFITYKLNISILISNILLFLLAFSNYSVTALRGTPLSVLDVLSVGTGLTIASTYKILVINFYLVLAVLSLLILLPMSLKIKFKFKKTKMTVLYRFLGIIILIAIMLLFITTDFIKIFFLETHLWIPSNEYHANGFLASFVKQAKELMIEEPKNYSLKKVEETYDSNIFKSTPVVPETEKPNIIVIMNESFSDMRVHRDFETSEEYLPYLNKLLDTTISGNIHTSVYGGKTPNSEWEFLTNNSMAFLSYGTIPYQQFIKNHTYSLVSTLEDQGYSSYALHPWYKTGYRRSSVYRLFGFNSFLALEDLDGELEYIRNYPSDLSTYKKVIELFENKKENELFFNFTVTMQNHSGYDYIGNNFNSTIKLKDIENCPRAEQYLSVIKKSDEALEYLINYFNNVNEKTIIVFFGDHQPPYLEQEFWDYLNYNKTEDSLKDSETGYITPYFIWANYNLPSYEVKDISLNYLSILLLDVAGLKTTPYMDYLREMKQSIPVITGHGYMDSSHTYHELTEDNEYSSLIKDYEILQYNNMFDIKNIFTKMFTIEKDA